MNQPVVIVVGHFDGVHRGHQALFARARRVAASWEARVVAMAFEDHPGSVLHPERVPPMLLHRDQRAAALREAGADDIHWLAPNRELFEQAPRQFIESLTARYDLRAMVEGHNFRFGHRRAGDIDTLHAIGSELGFDVEVVEEVPVVLRDKTISPVSSTLVRWLLAHGRAADATCCLGRPWAMRGEVIAGEQRGRTIGFPTANLDTGRQMLPAHGVYAAIAEADGRTVPAAVSVGIKPTFDPVEPLAEAHLLDFEGDLYGSTLTLHLTRWLRDQYPFPDVEALRAQLSRDVDQVRRLAAAELLEPTCFVREGAGDVT